MSDEFTIHDEQSEPVKLLQSTELKRLDVTAPDFQKRLEHLKRLDDISEQLGDSNPALQTAERVTVELSHIAKPALATFCAQHVYDWFNDKNPHHIDMVMMTCNEYGVEPTPTIIKLAAQVARARLEGAPAGTPEKLIKDNVKGQAFRLMLNLIHSGATLTEAADKAAQWQRDNYPEKPDFKASSLQKEYAQKFRKKDDKGQTREAFYFSRWDSYKTEQNQEHWSKVREVLPLADDDLIGVRR